VLYKIYFLSPNILKETCISTSRKWLFPSYVIIQEETTLTQAASKTEHADHRLTYNLFNWLPAWTVQNTAKYSLRWQKIIWLRDSLLPIMSLNWLVDLELFTTCYTKLDKKQTEFKWRAQKRTMHQHWWTVWILRCFSIQEIYSKILFALKDLGKLLMLLQNYVPHFLLFNKTVTTRPEKCKACWNTPVHFLQILNPKSCLLKWKLYHIIQMLHKLCHHCQS
jgi:hypothetical protein